MPTPRLLHHLKPCRPYGRACSLANNGLNGFIRLSGKVRAVEILKPNWRDCRAWLLGALACEDLTGCPRAQIVLDPGHVTRKNTNQKIPLPGWPNDVLDTGRQGSYFYTIREIFADAPEPTWRTLFFFGRNHSGSQMTDSPSNSLSPHPKSGATSTSVYM